MLLAPIFILVMFLFATVTMVAGIAFSHRSSIHIVCLCLTLGFVAVAATSLISKQHGHVLANELKASGFESEASELIKAVNSGDVFTVWSTMFKCSPPAKFWEKSSCISVLDGNQSPLLSKASKG